MDSLNFKYDGLKYILEKKSENIDVHRVFQRMVGYNIQTEKDLRLKRTGVKDLQEMVVTESFENIKAFEGVSGEQRLAQENFNTVKKLGQERSRISSRKIAGKILRKVGNGVETASTGLSFAQGGIDTAAGSDMIDRARDLRSRGEISESEYNEMMRNGRLRVAQGSFGIASGMKNVGEFVGKRIKNNLAKNLAKRWRRKPYGLRLLLAVPFQLARVLCRWRRMQLQQVTLQNRVMLVKLLCMGSWQLLMG